MHGRSARCVRSVLDKHRFRPMGTQSTFQICPSGKVFSYFDSDPRERVATSELGTYPAARGSSARFLVESLEASCFVPLVTSDFWTLVRETVSSSADVWTRSASALSPPQPLF